MPKTNYTSCLRPANTALLVKLLHQGSSINLIGQPEAGRKRMLDDIEQCVTTVKHIRLNMKTYTGSYNALCKSIAEQVGILYTENIAFEEVVLGISRLQTKIFILIDNFDAALNNPDLHKSYNRSFFDGLNSLRNKTNIALLCATTKAHDGAIIYIDGKDNGASWLDFTKESLLPLGHENIQVELDRRLKDNILWKNADTTTKQLYANEIFGKNDNYDFLDFMAKRFEQQNSTDIHTTSIEEKISRWKKEFKKLHHTTGRKKAAGWRKWLHEWAIILRLEKISKWAPARTFGNFIKDVFNKNK